MWPSLNNTFYTVTPTPTDPVLLILLYFSCQSILPAHIPYGLLFFIVCLQHWTECNLHNKYGEFHLCTVISTCLEYSLVFQSINHVQLFATLRTAARQAPLSSPVSRGLLKFMSTELVLLSNHLILCRPLLLLPSIPASALRIRWPEY